MAKQERRLMRTKDGVIFGYTNALAARSDMMEVLDDGKIVPVVNKPVAHSITGSKKVEDAQAVVVPEDPTPAPEEPTAPITVIVKDTLTAIELEEMTKAKIVEYAKARYGVDLKTNDTKERLCSEVYRLQTEAQNDGEEEGEPEE